MTVVAILPKLYLKKYFSSWLLTNSPPHVYSLEICLGGYMVWMTYSPLCTCWKDTHKLKNIMDSLQMCIHLRPSNVWDTTSTIPAPPPQAGQDVYMIHKNICRDSVYLRGVTKTASPPNPLFVHPHIHIPLHFRPTPFGPVSPELLLITQEYWPPPDAFELLCFLILLSLPGWRFSKGLLFTVNGFWCSSFDETCGMGFWTLKPVWTREKSSKNQKPESASRPSIWLMNVRGREGEKFSKWGWKVMGLGTQFISFHHRGRESMRQQVIARLLSPSAEDHTSNTELPYVYNHCLRLWVPNWPWWLSMMISWFLVHFSWSTSQYCWWGQTFLSNLDGAIVDRWTCFASINSTVTSIKRSKLKIMISS